MDNANEICRLIVETTHDGIWIVSEAGIVTFLNKRIADMLGYEVSEILNRPVFDFMDTDVQQQAIDILSKSKKETFEQHEFKLRKKNGDPFWVQFESSPITEKGKYNGTLAIITDINNIKASDNKLIAHEQQLDLIYNSAIDSMWLIGVEPDGYRFESVNAAFKTVTGYTDEQVKGKWMEEVIPPVSHDLVRAKYGEAVRTGKVIDYIEIAPLPAGRRVGEIRVIPVKNNGVVSNLVCIANDITGKYEAEEQNRLYERQLSKAIINAQEQERLQVGLELHDNVNQVLAGALLSLGMVQELPPERTEEFIEKAKNYIGDAIKEIRGLSHRLSPVAFDNTSFRFAIEELIRKVNIRGLFSVEMKFENFEFSNENELKLNLYRMLQEQLSNIVKYSEATKVKIYFSRSNNIITLRIADNGIGFQSNTERTGIGLNNIKIRTESFSGNFTLNTSPGNGCEVVIAIPFGAY